MKYIHLVLIAGALMLVSCSAQKKLHNRLLGVWNVSNYQDSFEGSRTNLDNAGTVEFHPDSRGNKDINFRAMQAFRDNTPFNWDNTGNTVTIRGDASEFAKAWIITSNKKNKQVWKSTNGRGGIQQVTLSR